MYRSFVYQMNGITLLSIDFSCKTLNDTVSAGQQKVYFTPFYFTFINGLN